MDGYGHACGVFGSDSGHPSRDDALPARHRRSDPALRRVNRFGAPRGPAVGLPKPVSARPAAQAGGPPTAAPLGRVDDDSILGAYGGAGRNRSVSTSFPVPSPSSSVLPARQGSDRSLVD